MRIKKETETSEDRMSGYSSSGDEEKRSGEQRRGEGGRKEGRQKDIGLMQKGGEYHHHEAEMFVFLLFVLFFFFSCSVSSSFDFDLDCVFLKVYRTCVTWTGTSRGADRQTDRAYTVCMLIAWFIILMKG